MSHTLLLDLETYSPVDLKAAGAYAYAEHPEHEVLMCGFSIDGGPAQVAVGEAAIWRALGQPLSSPSVLKIAHNAQFDRVNISRLAGCAPGEYLDPAQWGDTMALAAENGLPASLDKLAKALGAEEKDAAGTRLISLFSKPDRHGNRRTADDEPEKWAEFVEYCRQDVDTLVDVYNRLPGWPHPSERTAWEVDQRINDRGIKADVPLARWALKQDGANRAVAETNLGRILGIDNANSVQQVMGGLANIGLELPNLRVATVTEYLERDDLTRTQRHALELRAEIALTAAKKYQALINGTNADGRLRGQFKFYGAHTGRWCLTGDHEVLTPQGWVRMDEWQGGEIASWSGDETISFQAANSVSFDYEGDLVEYSGTRIKQLSTPDHRMPVRRRTGALESVTVADIGAKRTRIAMRGFRNAGAGAVDDELRALVMTQADGHYTPSGTLKFHFSKGRKIERCLRLLRRVGVPFSERVNKETTTISIPRRAQPIWLAMFREKTWGPWLWDRSPAVFFDELEHWDGYRGGPNSIQYVTTNRRNADMVQAFAHLSGMFCRVLEKDRGVEAWAPAYVVNIWLTPADGHDLRESPRHVPFKGRVYCAETKTGYFLVRRHGSVWVTGNSGRGVQLQNLPRAELKHPEAVILDSQLGLSADAPSLKALVRQALLGPFVVADYAAIEARVLAWIAGESWAIEAFEAGRDIYVETAERMGGLTRQQGKVAVLALGYQGGVGALRVMGAQGSDEELNGLKVAWRKANRRIVRLWADLDAAFAEGGRAGRLRVTVQGRDRWVHLPSGRHLTYRNVRHESWRFRDDEGRVQTKRGWRFDGNLGRTDTYGGRLTENATQAIARDLLADLLVRLEDAGMDTVGHVHDEVLVDAPAGAQSPETAHLLEQVVDMMGDAPGWADGLPLAGEGFITERYRKG